VSAVEEAHSSSGPAIAGEDERDLRNRFANDRTFSLFASFYPFFSIAISLLVISSLEKAEGAER
jgi:hypothetical protein